MSGLSIAFKVNGTENGTGEVPAWRCIFSTDINKCLLQMAEGTVIFLFQYCDLSTLDLYRHKMTVKIEIIAVGNESADNILRCLQKIEIIASHFTQKTLKLFADQHLSVSAEFISAENIFHSIIK